MHLRFLFQEGSICHMPRDEARTRVRLSDADPSVRGKVKAKANRVQLTETRAAALRVKAKDYLVWDYGTDAQRGLAVHVLPSGAKTYRAYYYLPGDPNAKS